MDDWPESAMLLDVSSGEAGEFDRATRADGSSGARLPSPLGKLPAGARQPKNSAGDARYKGLCPPGDDDLHRYSRCTRSASSSPPTTEPARATR
jgi:hypothetical protein